jgi:hypothetical protein
MSKINYNPKKLLNILTAHEVSYKDLAGVGELLVFMQSESGIVRDSDLEICWEFMSRSTRYALLKRLTNRVLQIEQCDHDQRVRVIIWIIEWADCLQEELL